MDGFPNKRWVGYDAKNECGSCTHFWTNTLASPGGWCCIHNPSQASCGFGEICDDYEDKRKQC